MGEKSPEIGGEDRIGVDFIRFSQSLHSCQPLVILK